MPLNKRKYTFDRNEVFDIICFYMGQGDCSLIRCPDGTIIMIDCGSKGDFQPEFLNIVARQVRDPDWAGNVRIDALILTHKDADHHSKVGWVLGELQDSSGKVTHHKLAVPRIYFSWAKSDTSPLGRYTANGLNKVVYSHYFTTDELYEVTINSANNNFYQKWTKADDFQTVALDPVTKQKEVPISGRKLPLFQGITPGGKVWHVSLIAGNVLKESGIIEDLGDDEDGNPFKDGATEDNARSLVTLLEIGPKPMKALFCGDSTFSTEHFLTKYQSTYLSDAQFLLVPHHGSEWASSPLFVKTVKPGQVAVSAAYMEHSHLHPREKALQRWLDKVGLDTSHQLDYWKRNSRDADDTLADWQKRKLSVYTSDSGRFIWLTTLPPGGNVNYAVKSRVGTLYRAEIQRKLRETAFSIDLNNLAAPGQFLNYQIG
ncbi:MAG TPA: MBL fold metallo-hydrolase [Ktedonobacteraceae bacterium]